MGVSFGGFLFWRRPSPGNRSDKSLYIAFTSDLSQVFERLKSIDREARRTPGKHMALKVFKTFASLAPSRFKNLDFASSV